MGSTVQHNIQKIGYLPAHDTDLSSETGSFLSKQSLCWDGTNSPTLCGGIAFTFAMHKFIVSN